MRNKGLGKTELFDNARDRLFLAAHAKQDSKAIFIREAFRQKSDGPTLLWLKTYPARPGLFKGTFAALMVFRQLLEFLVNGPSHRKPPLKIAGDGIGKILSGAILLSI
jgi:hypothetical protein